PRDKPEDDNNGYASNGTPPNRVSARSEPMGASDALDNDHVQHARALAQLARLGIFRRGRIAERLIVALELNDDVARQAIALDVLRLPAAYDRLAAELVERDLRLRHVLGPLLRVRHLGAHDHIALSHRDIPP